RAHVQEALGRGDAIRDHHEKDAQKRLQRAGPLQEEPELIDEDRHQEDVEKIAPVEIEGGDLRQQRLDHMGSLRTASQREAARAASRTSCTRMISAPPAMANACAARLASRRSAGDSTLSPLRKDLRDAPIRIGRPSDVSALR